MSNPRYPEEFKIQAVNQENKNERLFLAVFCRSSPAAMGCRLLPFAIGINRPKAEIHAGN
ncbi:hypothetical protein [Pseudomonas alkylphenolica]|uniref:hypothetical protein n=1 Tax=Pseudomonas alkylphenolica TaxID=237609 RepID=UPI0012FE2AF0|nr:hypothetical protein [Pseudomonas alkylphenolica]